MTSISELNLITYIYELNLSMQENTVFSVHRSSLYIVGLAVGLRVGDNDGLRVGLSEGDRVGLIEGVKVGLNDGLKVL